MSVCNQHGSNFAKDCPECRRIFDALTGSELASSAGSAMTEADWHRLEDTNDPELLERTETQDEHPEWFNAPCYCRLCQSYADE